MEEVREYERTMQEKTNSKVKCSQNSTGEFSASDLHCTEIPQRRRDEKAEGGDNRGRYERSGDGGIDVSEKKGNRKFEMYICALQLLISHRNRQEMYIGCFQVFFFLAWYGIRCCQQTANTMNK